MQYFPSGRTVLVIAHRLSTIRSANLIYVIMDRKVTACHPTLIKRTPLPTALYRTPAGCIRIFHSIKKPKRLAELSSELRKDGMYQTDHRRLKAAQFAAKTNSSMMQKIY
ncbi:Protein CBG25405 [Caenorhabditis briggsae]|uniref:Protein CBG25405 n=1 Tax=Caenorhabditis briggsae TaxID=6238 RepID=B6IH57_CAEBR|nr:Protein CBG25405 [Caenorhabditis briggsae]CAR99237.1 Protein CBG25405 [Caenorhabditis briggsae]